MYSCFFNTNQRHHLQLPCAIKAHATLINARRKFPRLYVSSDILFLRKTFMDENRGRGMREELKRVSRLRAASPSPTSHDHNFSTFRPFFFFFLISRSNCVNGEKQKHHCAVIFTLSAI